MVRNNTVLFANLEKKHSIKKLSCTVNDSCQWLRKDCATLLVIQLPSYYEFVLYSNIHI